MVILAWKNLLLKKDISLTGVDLRQTAHEADTYIIGQDYALHKKKSHNNEEEEEEEEEEQQQQQQQQQQQ